VPLATMPACGDWQRFVNGKNYFGFLTTYTDSLVYCRIYPDSMEILKKAKPRNLNFTNYDCDSSGNWVLGSNDNSGLMYYGNIRDTAPCVAVLRANGASATQKVIW
jgi:hypothetical protein